MLQVGLPVLQYTCNWATTRHNQQNGIYVQRRLSRTQCFFMRTAKTVQSGRMPRLIWVFAGRTDHFVGFVVFWLIYTVLRIIFNLFSVILALKGSICYNNYIKVFIIMFYYIRPGARQNQQNDLRALRTFRTNLALERTILSDHQYCYRSTSYQNQSELHCCC